MNRGLVKEGRVYENKRGRKREVTKISETRQFIDGYIVTYRSIKEQGICAEKYCTLGAFAKWARKEAT